MIQWVILKSYQYIIIKIFCHGTFWLVKIWIMSTHCLHSWMSEWMDKSHYRLLYGQHGHWPCYQEWQETAVSTTYFCSHPHLRLWIALFAVAEGWLLLDIGWFVSFWYWSLVASLYKEVYLHFFKKMLWVLIPRLLRLVRRLSTRKSV